MTMIELETLQYNSSQPMILFLDIDGPVIDLHTYKTEPVVSFYRTRCNQTSVKNINKLCSQFNLKIVTNSMHNWYNVENRTLKDDLINWGINEEYLHPDWRTVFPNVDYSLVNSSVRGAGRLYSINKWLEKNLKYEWICFDDRKFTNDVRLIHIQREFGIDAGYYAQAAKTLKMLANHAYNHY